MKATLCKPTPVRFRKETEEKIREVAVRFGLRPASVIRFAVDNQLAEFDRSGQIIIERKETAVAQ